MIDFIKIQCNYIGSDTWESNELLDFETLVRINTGELSDGRLTAKYQGLEFRIIPPSKEGQPHIYEIRGSIHKFSNDGQYNFDDFHLLRLVDSIEVICTQFSLEPSKCFLRNIEFGVNIELPVLADDFISGLVCFGNTRFSDLNVRKLNIGRTSKKDQYQFKIYNKGIQSEIPQSNLLRVEIHANKMQFIRQSGIKTLADICDPRKLERLGETLIKKFGDVVFVNPKWDKSALSDKEKLFLSNCSSHIHWEQLSKASRYNDRKKLGQLISKHFPNNLFSYALFLAYNKWITLLEIGGYEAQKLRLFYRKKYADEAEVFATFLQLECSVNKSLFTNRKKTVDFPRFLNTYTPISSTTKPPKTVRTFCATCGRDISHQRKNSRFCSEKYFGKDGKRCRNAASNKKRNQKARAKKNDLNKVLKAISKTDFLVQINFKVSNKKLVAYQKNLSKDDIGHVDKVKSIALTINSIRYELEGFEMKKVISEILKANQYEG